MLILKTTLQDGRRRLQTHSSEKSMFSGGSLPLADSAACITQAPRSSVRRELYAWAFEPENWVGSRLTPV